MPDPQSRLHKIWDDLAAPSSPMEFVSVPIPCSLYNEFILRTGSDCNVPAMIVEQTYNFLERTIGDPDIWSQEHADAHGDSEALEWRDTYGPSHKGHQWKELLLLNGTKIKMTYKGKDHFAEVRHEMIVSGEGEYTPSEWVSHVAGGTSRNAWRDLHLLFPRDETWIPADEERRYFKLMPQDRLFKRILQADPARTLAFVKESMSADKFEEFKDDYEGLY